VRKTQKEDKPDGRKEIQKSTRKKQKHAKKVSWMGEENTLKTH